MSHELSPPLIETWDGIQVVRDDLIAGGTKARVIHVLFDDADEYVYASPVYGYAQIALAHVAARLGKRAVVFCARRGKTHPRTAEAYNAGANIYQVDCGYMSVVRARAKEYCRETGAKLLPFGLDDPRIIHALADVARGLDIVPKEVWCVAGSGTLSRALQAAWPDAQINAVRVGAEPDAGLARVFVAPEKFEAEAKVPPPFPSCGNYDAKAWRFIRQHAQPGALFWNVAA